MSSGQAVEEKEEIWDHDKFRERSLSPERPAPSDTWDSRKGNWKARAGVSGLNASVGFFFINLIIGCLHSPGKGPR